MMVLILEKVPAALRGELTLWLIEVRTGVFVGRVSGQVRDLLWERVCNRRGAGGTMLVYQTNCEQGFAIRSDGEMSRQVVNYDGLQLIRVADRPSQKHHPDRE